VKSVMKLLLIDVIYWMFSPLRFLFQRFLRRSFLDLLPKLFRDVLEALFLTSRFYFYHERQLFFSLSRLKGNSFIDIGAECGHYVLMLSTNFKEILAFEPSPKIFPCLIKLELYRSYIGNS
jgi:hypothetical protein